VKKRKNDKNRSVEEPTIGIYIGSVLRGESTVTGVDTGNWSGQQILKMSRRVGRIEQGNED
jgi:hypothetical protein